MQQTKKRLIQTIYKVLNFLLAGFIIANAYVWFYLDPSFIGNQAYSDFGLKAPLILAIPCIIVLVYRLHIANKKPFDSRKTLVIAAAIPLGFIAIFSATLKSTTYYFAHSNTLKNVQFIQSSYCQTPGFNQVDYDCVVVHTQQANGEALNIRWYNAQSFRSVKTGPHKNQNLLLHMRQGPFGAIIDDIDWAPTQQVSGHRSGNTNNRRSRLRDKSSQ